MNKYLNILNTSMRDIIGAQPERTPDNVLHDFAMSTWWLSIDQIEYFCGGGKGLWDGLRELRHVSPKSGDIIWDHYRIKHLNSIGRAMLEAAQKMNNRAIV